MRIADSIRTANQTSPPQETGEAESVTTEDSVRAGDTLTMPADSTDVWRSRRMYDSTAALIQDSAMTNADSIKPGLETLPDSLQLIKDEPSKADSEVFTPPRSAIDTVRYRGPKDTLRLRRHKKKNEESARTDSLIMEGNEGL